MTDFLQTLFAQVASDFFDICDLSCTTVYGGVGFDTQMNDLRRGVDIVIGTPGRVMDLLEKGVLNFQQIRNVVLDEADEMLNIGFAEDVEEILKQIPK